MDVKWTEEQQRVIDLYGRNILVSAAAGSGKTAVLVERIITMLTAPENPLSVDELLVVTFAEAAAAEMKDRVRAAIERKLEAHPDNEHLKQQATLIHNAQITTIHSFCLSVLKDHFHEIDLDPGFRVGEEGELKLLRHDVLADMLEERYQLGDTEYLDFVLSYGNARNDKNIEELILKIYEFSRSYPDAAGWLDSCNRAYQADTVEELERSSYICLAMERAKRCLDEAMELTMQGIAVCQEADGPAAYEDALLADKKMLEDALLEETYVGLNEKMRKISWKKLSPNRDKTVSEEKTAFVKAVRGEVKGLTDDLALQYFYQSVDEMLEDIRLVRPKMMILTGLVEEFSERFERAKRERELIDFSDMEQYALRILAERDGDKLVPSAAAGEYQRQFHEIMIDEYQDSNFIQETILTSISTISEGRYNVFMVGDVKQSIYRFRLSRPELFMEKYHTYSTEDGTKVRIDLHKNFRSRREVLESANFIFRQIMTKELGGITYDDRAALYTGAEYKEAEGAGVDARTEILVIESDVKGDSKKLPRITERELEARTIAGKIRELMREHKIIDKETGAFRNLHYSDIVILTRSVQGFADVFTEVLNAEGIPAYAGTREGYFSTQEIGVLMDYLRVLQNVKQDIPLASVLASPFCGLDEEELAVIRTADKGLPFYEAVINYRREGDNPAVRGKLSGCFEKMEEFRKRIPYTPIHELLERILEETGYKDFMSAMPGGAQRKANLEMLEEKARIFESSSYKGLFHFVRYIEQLQKYNVDYGEAALEDEQSDTVRIMTIHKSKGLEFPVVFAAGMGKGFNMQDARSSAVLHARLGIGLDAVDTKSCTKSPSIIKKVLRKEEALDSLGEELRVLYVALTRAKEKLIITGTLSDFHKKMSSFEVLRGQKKQELSFGRLSKAASYWDYILPSMLRLTPDIPIVLKIISIEDIVREEIEEETADRIKQSVLEGWNTGRVYDPEMKELLKKEFGYTYAYAKNSLQKLKYTVSEIKKGIRMQGGYDEKEDGGLLYEEPEVIPLVPQFLKEKEELSGAPRGTAYHRVMELLDLKKEYTSDTLESEIRSFQEKGRISSEMADSVRVNDILRFLQSTAGRRMQESARKGRLKREQPFVIAVSAGELYPEGEGEEILVQGIIDAYFEESDGLVVLDYKTDRIRTERELAEKYHMQLDYYAKALEQMLAKKVKEKIIYSFALQKEIFL